MRVLLVVLAEQVLAVIVAVRGAHYAVDVESMRFRGAAIERSGAALIGGQVNVLRWRAPENGPQFGAPQILMLSGLLGGTASLRAEECPQTYAGTALNIMSRTSLPFDSTVQLGEEFTKATGIKLNVTRIAPSDHCAKLMLDWSSGTNPYDVSLFVYQWKADLAPFLADLTNLENEVKGAPELELADYAPRCWKSTVSRTANSSVCRSSVMSP
jgi:hypothetical protein